MSNIQWNPSFGGTPQFRDHKIWYMLPLLKGHLYSGERDTFSRSQNQGLTSILGKPLVLSTQKVTDHLNIVDTCKFKCSQWQKLSKLELSHLQSMYCTFNTQHRRDKLFMIFYALSLYLAARNNDCSRFHGRLKGKYFIYWLIIKKPEPSLYSGDTCVSPKGVS